jgi:hypothetical protein
MTLSLVFKNIHLCFCSKTWKCEDICYNACWYKHYCICKYMWFPRMIRQCNDYMKLQMCALPLQMGAEGMEGGASGNLHSRKLVSFTLSGKKIFKCGISLRVCIWFFFFWCYWGLNSGLHACKKGTLSLETHLQPILLWLLWRWGPEKYLPGLALNHQPPDLSLPSN